MAKSGKAPETDVPSLGCGKEGKELDQELEPRKIQ